MAERLSLATVTEMAATTAYESRGDVAKNDDKKRAEAEEAVESGGHRTDFNNEEEPHEDEVCHRKHGALVLD